MKLLFSIILIITCLSSCSIEHHLSQGQKHIDIAKRKGAVIKPDTVWQYSYKLDTVWNTQTNMFETKHILKDSFPYTVTNTISAGMTRQERKAMEDLFKHMEKMMKLQNDSLSKALNAAVKINKQDGKVEKSIAKTENKNPWFFRVLPWLIIFGYLFIKYIYPLIYPKPRKKEKDEQY